MSGDRPATGQHRRAGDADKFRASDWYWLVLGHDGKVFSSAAGSYVDTSDAGYREWCSRGNLLTHVMTDGELTYVLARHGAPAMTVAAAGASDWGATPTESIVDSVLAAGVDVASKSNKKLSGTYACDAAAQSALAVDATHVYATGGPSDGKFTTGKQTRSLTSASGTSITLGPSDWVTLSEAVTQYAEAVRAWVDGGMRGKMPPRSVAVP